MHTLSKAHTIRDDHAAKGITQIIDYKVTMLIAAGAAMAANCEPCLNKIVPDLIEAGVAEADIHLSHLRFSHERTPNFSYARLAYHYGVPGIIDDFVGLTNEDVRPLNYPADWQPAARCWKPPL